MGVTTTPHFIIIDDDPINNMLCELLIKSKTIISSATVQTFTEPREVLEHIKDNYQNPSAQLTVLLLDINMPSMTGWQFLEYFELLSPIIKMHFKVYILSSSISSNDREFALANKNVVDYIVKPLTNEKVNSIVTEFYS